MVEFFGVFNFKKARKLCVPEQAVEGGVVGVAPGAHWHKVQRAPPSHCSPVSTFPFPQVSSIPWEKKKWKMRILRKKWKFQVGVGGLTSTRSARRHSRFVAKRAHATCTISSTIALFSGIQNSVTTQTLRVSQLKKKQKKKKKLRNKLKRIPRVRNITRRKEWREKKRNHTLTVQAYRRGWVRTSSTSTGSTVCSTVALFTSIDESVSTKS